jgi:endo-1,4-beta-xylanase
MSLNLAKKLNLSFTLMVLLFIFIASKSFSQQPLKEVFQDYYLIGTAINDNQISGADEKLISVVQKHFNSITPENVLKWERVHPTLNKFNFEPADKFVEFGIANNLHMVGHTLVWHSQTPKWVFEDESGNPLSRDAMLDRLRNHIANVVGRYKGKIHGWDVVNEAFNEDGSYRESKWFKIIGEDYIEKAFEFAHAADPDAELYYNDYNEWYPKKRDRIVKMVNDLKEKGIRIDGIGMQGHWGLDYPLISEADDAIKAYSEAGMKVMITELDMDILPSAWDISADVAKTAKYSKELNPWPDFLPDSMQVVQAKRYAEYFNLFNKYKESISRVTLWGVHDAQSWKNYWPVNGRSAYPLLFDKNLNPKPAFDAVISTVK